MNSRLRALHQTVLDCRAAKRAASANRLATNPDDEFEYDAANDRYEACRFALERASAAFIDAWAAQEVRDSLGAEAE